MLRDPWPHKLGTFHTLDASHTHEACTARTHLSAHALLGSRTSGDEVDNGVLMSLMRVLQPSPASAFRATAGFCKRLLYITVSLRLWSRGRRACQVGCIQGSLSLRLAGRGECRTSLCPEPLSITWGPCTAQPLACLAGGLGGRWGGGSVSQDGCEDTADIG